MTPARQLVVSRWSWVSPSQLPSVCTATEVAADALAEEWKGCVAWINGGNNKQSLPMKQGGWRPGERTCPWVKDILIDQERGITRVLEGSDANQSVQNLVIFLEKRKEDSYYADLTDATLPLQLGPQRANSIWQLLHLSTDEAQQHVIRKPLNKEGKKLRTKATTIQYLVTQRVLQHKCPRIALEKQITKKSLDEAAEFAKFVAKKMKGAKEKHQEKDCLET